MNALCTLPHTPFDITLHSQWKMGKTSIAQHRQRSNEKNHPIRYTHTHAQQLLTHTHTHTQTAKRTGKTYPVDGVVFPICALWKWKWKSTRALRLLRLRCSNAIFSFPSIWPDRVDTLDTLLASWTLNQSRYSLSGCQGCQAASWPLLKSLVALVMASRSLGSFCSYRSPPTRIRTHSHTHKHTYTHRYTYENCSRGHTTKSQYLYLMRGQLAGHGHRAYCSHKLLLPLLKSDSQIAVETLLSIKQLSMAGEGKGEGVCCLNWV